MFLRVESWNPESSDFLGLCLPEAPRAKDKFHQTTHILAHFSGDFPLRAGGSSHFPLAFLAKLCSVKAVEGGGIPP